MTDKPFAGQVAVVTGAGRGIGAATALLLAERGANVAIASRSEGELITVARGLADRQVVGLPIKCDVTDETQVKRLFREVRERLGPVDVLVNNAGNVLPGPIADMSLETYRGNVDANLTSAFLCSREALADMVPRKKGRIVNVASVSGVSGVSKFPGFAAYAAAKAAVIAFTEALAAEVGASGVRVTCVSPGSVDTKLLATVAPQAKADMAPDDVARAIVWLASPEAQAVNGSNLVVWGK
jgi:NAD(P)-dependent dehydrogenase (short-subunit alcohol dehydrogenase family)